MTTHEERIQTMVATGRVSEEEGAQLRAAIDPGASPPAWAALLDPLAHLSTPSALMASALVAALGMGLGIAAGVRFDGALDAHVGGPPVSVGIALLEQVLAWPLVAALAYGAARLAGAKARTRAIDMLSAVGLARLPLVMSAVVSYGLMPRISPGADVDTVIRTMSEGSGLWRILMVACLSLPLVVWFFALLVRGYRTASGLSGRRLAISAVGFIIVAEVVSKAILLAL